MELEFGRKAGTQWGRFGCLWFEGGSLSCNAWRGHRKYKATSTKSVIVL